MKEKLDKIREKLTPSLAEIDIVITDITFSKNSKYNFLTIELDKESGIDLDTIVEATNIINPLIDELDIIDDSYILDVISKERG
ncbi:MAG: hypothetical protein IJA94_05780 [Bacilli bacterium]|nr:hypothetical protein [Bacilli bacterium]